MLDLSVSRHEELERQATSLGCQRRLFSCCLARSFSWRCEDPRSKVRHVFIRQMSKEHGLDRPGVGLECSRAENRQRQTSKKRSVAISAIMKFGAGAEEDHFEWVKGSITDSMTTGTLIFQVQDLRDDRRALTDLVKCEHSPERVLPTCRSLSYISLSVPLRGGLKFWAEAGDDPFLKGLITDFGCFAPHYVGVRD